VGRERVVGVELLGDLHRQLRVQSLLLVEAGEFGELLVGHLGQLAAFDLQQRPLSVALGAHRHVLADSHRQGPGGESGDAGGQDREWVERGAGDADDDARGRDDAVIRPEDGGPQAVHPSVVGAGGGLFRLVGRRVVSGQRRAFGHAASPKTRGSSSPPTGG
jgi:hypothetical protein